MSSSKLPDCPECEKLSSIANDSHKIGDFLDWLSEQGVTFARWDDHHERWECHELDYLSPNVLLARYFEIDLNKVEQERRDILKWLQENNQREENG